jgi:hypothetical protein
MKETGLGKTVINFSLCSARKPWVKHSARSNGSHSRLENSKSMVESLLTEDGWVNKIKGKSGNIG